MTTRIARLSRCLRESLGPAGPPRRCSAASNEMSTGHLVVEQGFESGLWGRQIKKPPFRWLFYLATPRGFEPRLPP